MHKSGRNESCPRRRGFFRRPHFIYLVFGVVFLYIVYRTFLGNNETTIPSYEKNFHLTQTRLVQAEERTAAAKVEKHPNFDIAEETGDENENERSENRDVGDKPAADDEDDGDYQELDSEEQENVKRYHQMENLESDNTTETNKTSDPAKGVNETLKALGNETNLIAKLNMTLSNMTTDSKLSNRTTDVLKRDFEVNKAKLIEDLSSQTQELANVLKDTLIKNRANLTGIHYQNKTKFIDKNVTKLIDSFTSKAQNTVKLAKTLLDISNSSLPDEKLKAIGLNKRKIEEIYSMEAQNLIKIAKDVFSKTNETVSDLMFENKTKLIEKFDFDAQKLAKFASTMNRNRTVNVPDARQRLPDNTMQFEKNSPFIIYNRNMTGEVIKTNATQKIVNV